MPRGSHYFTHTLTKILLSTDTSGRAMGADAFYSSTAGMPCGISRSFDFTNSMATVYSSPGMNENGGECYIIKVHNVLISLFRFSF